jgi:hypothetical protein
MSDISPNEISPYSLNFQEYNIKELEQHINKYIFGLD